MFFVDGWRDPHGDVDVLTVTSLLDQQLLPELRRHRTA
jgi:hypothetical protein